MSIRDDLKAYLDGELPPQRAEEVRAAIEQDDSLRQEVEFMRLLSKSLRAAEKPAPVEGYEETVARVAKGRPWPAWLRWGVAGGGCVAGLLLLGWAGSLVTGRPVTEVARMEPRSRSAISGATRSFAGVADMAEQAPAEAMAKRSISRPPFGGQGYTSSPATTAPPSTSSNMVLGNRQIVETADLSLRVKDARAAMLEAVRITSAAGGYVANRSISGPEEGEPEANLTLRIPQPRMDDVLDKLRALGTVVTDNSNEEDVTLSLVDLEARLRAMRAEEDQYLTLLKSAKRVGEIMAVKDRLSQVRREIESVDAQRRALSRMAELGTIELTLTQRPKPDEEAKPSGWFDDTVATATNALKGAGKLLAQGLIYLFVLAPIWLPVVGVVWWLRRKAS